MKKELYINVNGLLCREDENVFSANNRAFKYGDGLFETIRVVDGEPCFIEDHFKRLKLGMQLLKMKSSRISFNELKQQILLLLEKNEIHQGGRIRLSVYRTGEGYYTPINQGKAYLIEAIPLKDNEYTLNDKGLNIDMYNEVVRYRIPLSQVKTINAIPLVLAGIHKSERDLDECIILNDQKRISETISANLFLYKNHSLYTPEIAEGCVNGIMRQQIIKIADQLNINVFEGILTRSMLLQADEMFLTNAVKGIQWVESFQQKKYVNDATKEFVVALNQLVKEREIVEED